MVGCASDGAGAASTRVTLAGGPSDGPRGLVFESPSSVAKPARRLPLERGVLVGVLGAVLLIGGFTLHLALITPAYLYGDEQAHVGYALVLGEGSLPTIDSAIPLEDDDPLRSRVERESQRPHRTEVYVANNPPFVYLAVAATVPVIERLFGSTSPTLLLLRLVNVAGSMIAVVCTYLLARELAGRDDVVGVAAAGLLASTIGIALISSIAGLDGVALAATTGLTWALARAARTPSPRRFLHIGAWAALAAAVRPMSSAYAAGAIVLGLLIAWRASGLRSLPGVTLRLIGPALLLTGWFYALNQYRYGDPAGSAALFEKLDRGIPSAPVSREQVSYLVGHLFLDTDVRTGLAPYLGDSDASRNNISLLSLIALAAAVCIAILTSRSERRVDAPRSLIPSAWASMLVLAAIPIVLVQQHWSAGGGLYPRYLLPIVPIIAAAIALLARRVGRWVPLVIVAAAAIWQLTRVDRAVDVLTGRTTSQFGGSPPLAGSGSVAVAVTATLTGVGACLLIVGLAVVSHRGVGRQRLRASRGRPAELGLPSGR